MPWFEKRFIGIHIHKRAGAHSQIVAKTDDIDNVAYRIAHFFECGQVADHQLIEQFFNIVRIAHQVHQEVVHPAQESSPFKKVAPANNEQSFICALS